MGILDLFKLNGRYGLVTGAARGIGQAIASGLCEAGAKVAVVDIDIKEAENTVGKLTDLGYECFLIHADVTIEDQVQEMVDSVIKR